MPGPETPKPGDNGNPNRPGQVPESTLVLGEKGPEGQRRLGQLSRYGLISSQRTQEWEALSAQQQATEIRMYVFAII